MTFDDKLDKILLSHGAEQGGLHYSLKKAIKDLVLSDLVGADEVWKENKDGILEGIELERVWAKNKLRAEQRSIINGKESSNE